MNLFKFFVVLIVLITSVNPVFSNSEESFTCGNDGNLTSTFSGRNGERFTSLGTVRALVVFVQFAEDNISPPAPNWPVNSGPAYLNTVLDASPDQNLQNGGLTHYFREMSFGNFIVYGDEYWRTTDKTKQQYLNETATFSIINKDVLNKLNSTETINFSDYDN